MAIKIKKQVKKIEENEFKKVAPISGGNAYETHVECETKDRIMRENVGGAINNIWTEIGNHTKEYLDKVVPKWWIILQEQANYFCNQIQFDIDDTKLRRQIINIIRSSFYNGVSGLYYNDITNDFEAVVLSNLDYDASDNLCSARYSLAKNYLSGINEKFTSEFKGEFKIPKSKINNLSVFKWGTEALHSFLRIKPYIDEQESLMKMLSVQKFAYNKKYIYNCNSPSAAKKELELFFKEDNIFLINAGFGKNAKEMENEFSELTINNGSALEFIQFYNERMSIIYKQIGRRENVDTKKERNVSGEVQASQENYDILYRDVAVQFDIFVKDANTILNRTNKATIEFNVEVKNEVQRIDTEDGNKDMNN